MSTQVKESYFWQQVKAGLEDPETHLCRIENTAGTGISDINACSFGKEVWIELKVFHGNRLYFRNSQRSWIARRRQVGGNIFLLARRDDELLLYDAYTVIGAKSTAHSDKKSFSVNSEDLPNPLYSCKKPFKWGEIKQKIFGQS